MAATSKIIGTVAKPEKPKDIGRFITSTEGLKIVSVAQGWKDTPYAAKGTKYAGGNPMKKVGADCSGSVWAIYKEAGFSYGHYFNTVKFVNLVASDPNFIAAWLQKMAGTETNFVKGQHFFKKVLVPQPGDIGWWEGHMAIYDVNAGKTEKGQVANLWSASQPGGRDFGPAHTNFYDNKHGAGAVTWYRYWKAP